MEEVLNQPGVEDAPVAGEQGNAADAGQPKTGVEETAGEKPADSVPAAGEGVDPKAFAARLAQERERLRRELEAELEPKVRQKLEVELKARQQQAELAQRMAEVGLDPSLLEGYFASHPAEVDRVVTVYVLLAFVLGAAVTAASFYFALRWRFEVEHSSPPTVLPPKPPPADLLTEQAKLLQEWFEGKGEEVE